MLIELVRRLESNGNCAVVFLASLDLALEFELALSATNSNCSIGFGVEKVVALAVIEFILEFAGFVDVPLANIRILVGEGNENLAGRSKVHGSDFVALEFFSVEIHALCLDGLCNLVEITVLEHLSTADAALCEVATFHVDINCRNLPLAAEFSENIKAEFFNLLDVQDGDFHRLAIFTGIDDESLGFRIIGESSLIVEQAYNGVGGAVHGVCESLVLVLDLQKPGFG